MTLSERIEADYLTAYKAKDSLRVSVLRLLKTACKNLQVELMRPITDEEVLAVIQKQAKQRQDSVEQFSAAGRMELAEKETAELDVLREYLPAPLSAEELATIVEEEVKAAGMPGMAGMGRIIQSILGRYKGRVDGRAVSEAVKRRLQSLN